MRTFLAVVLLVLLTVAAFAEDTQTVVCSGTGKDQAEAEKAALRNAVEQAVGALVDAETLVKNDEVVSNQVLSHSDGFVEKWEAVGEPKKGSGGETTVKIKAIVRRNKLIEMLTEGKVTLKDVDGKSLFGEAVTKMEGKKDAVALFKKAFEGVPETLLVAEVKEQKVVKEGDPCTIEVAVEVKFDMDAYSKKFLPNLIKVLEQTCSKKNTSPIITTGSGGDGEGNLKIAWSELSQFESDCIAINISRNQAGDNMKWNQYSMEPGVLEKISSELSPRMAKLRISFQGKDNLEIREDEVVRFDFGQFVLYGLGNLSFSGKLKLIAPMIMEKCPEDIFYWVTFPIKHQTKLSLAELKQVTSIKCYFVPFMNK